MKNPTRLMIINSDVRLLQSLDQLFTNNGYDVSLADSGEQAITFIENGFIPELILLNVEMPIMNGYDIFREIRQRIDSPIFFTAKFHTADTELACLRLGAVDYIQIPFTDEILLARVKNHIHNSSSVRQIENSKRHVAAQYDTEKLTSMDAILTDTEFNVGKLIAAGYSNHEIADQLNFSYGYIKKIAYRIFDKLNISKRTQLREYFMK